MAATDIKSVLELLRTKVHGADSSTSLDELNNMVKAAQLAHTPMIRHYDSDGSLPTATTTEQRLAFITSTGSIKMNNGRRWESTVSTASEGGGGVFTYQGTQYGYSTAGGAGAPELNTVDKYPFSSDGNATDVGDYVENAKTGAGSSSSTAGYVSGGFTSASVYLKGINKRLFASDASESNIGDLDLGEHHGVMRNAGNSSSTDGYHSGGIALNSVADYRKAINKISFSSDGNGTNIGDLTTTNANYPGKGEAAGISSTTDGYVVGGSNPAIPEFSSIDKFPFAADGNATNIGDLPRGVRNHAGHNSSTHGYTAGGTNPSIPVGMSNVIEKFAFASDTTTAGDVGDLTAGRYGPAGTSSTSSGYTAGGHYPAPSVGFIIDKFPFAADGNATDVGDLTVARSKFAPTQV